MTSRFSPSASGSESGSPEDDLRAAAAHEGLHVTDVDRVRLPDGTPQYSAEAPPPEADRAGRGIRRVGWALGGAAVAGVLSVVGGMLGSDALQGGALAAALLLLAGAAIVVANRLLPVQVTLQERHRSSVSSTTASPDHRPTDPTPNPATVSLHDKPRTLTRRGLLGGVLAAVTAIVAALVVPLRGLGPTTADERAATGWGRGVRAVDVHGQPVRTEDVPLGGVLTVFPAGSPGSADGQTVIMRLPTDALTSATAGAATPDGLLGYSKVCTHAGCPVGQLQVDVRPPSTTYRLLCPCHQSLFDVTDLARPLSGPASRPLPQLPLGTDAEGFVVSLADFDQRVGPGRWST